MKFTQLLTALSVATFAVAVPTVLSRSDGGSCAAAGGTTQCCAQKFGDPDNKDIIKSLTAPGGLLTDLLGLNLDGVVKDTTAQVGVACMVFSTFLLLPLLPQHPTQKSKKNELEFLLI